MITFTPICSFVTSFAARDAVKVEQHRRSRGKIFMLKVSGTQMVFLDFYSDKSDAQVQEGNGIATK